MKTQFLKIVALFLAVMVVCPAHAESYAICANRIVSTSTVTLGTNGLASFSITLSEPVSTIKVTSVTLQRKNQSGNWEFAETLKAPTKTESNSPCYSENKTYDISHGYTYRIIVVFQIGSETYTSTSKGTSI